MFNLLTVFLLYASGNAKENNALTLTLEEAINLSLKANRGIISSQFNVQNQHLSLEASSSEFEYKIVPAASAGIGGGGSDSDSIGIGLSLQKKMNTGTKASFGPEFNRINDNYDTSVGISILQPLLRGFGRDVNLDGIRSAEFSVQTSLRNLYQTRVNTVLETVSSFYEIIRQKELVGLYESLGERLKAHSRLAKAKERVGLATPMDTFRANIRLKDTEDSMTRSVQAYRNAQDKLKNVLALSLETEITLIRPETVNITNIDTDNAIRVAFNNRVELEQAEADIREAERKSLILENKTLPELNLILDYERFGSDDKFSGSTGLDQYMWGVRLQSSTDIFRTAEKAAYRQGIINVQTLRLNLEDRREDIRRQVRSQSNAIKEDEKLMMIRKEQIREAEGKLALAEVKFAHGMADNFDVIEAETELQNARVNLLSSEIKYVIDTYNMRAVLGTMLERKGGSGEL